MKVYKITVTKWPTDDGKPWPRFIAGFGGYRGEGSGPTWEDLPWFEKLSDPDTSEVQDVIDHEFSVGDNEAGEVIGWILPNASRRHYLSASAARTWVRKARLLGAEVTLQVGEVTSWEPAE